MRLSRQVYAAALLALASCEEQSLDLEMHDCAWDSEQDGGAIELSEEPQTLRVCGDAQVWVQEEGDAVALRDLSVVAAPAHALRTDDGRLVLGVTPESPSLDIIVVPELIPDERTRNVYLGLNLDPSGFWGVPFDPLDPSGTSDYQTSLTLHASGHEPVDIRLYFTNNGGGAWSMAPMAPGSTPGTQWPLGEAELQFSADGRLMSMHHGTFKDPVSPELSWNLHLEPPPEDRFRFRTTSVAGDSGVEDTEQDGVASSRVSGLAVTSRGEVVGFGVDGRTLTLGWLLDGLRGWVVPVGPRGEGEAG